MTTLADDIKRLRELDAKRTQDKWYKMRNTSEYPHVVVNGRRGGLTIAECPRQKKEGFYNAKFIAAAPDAVHTINALVELVGEMDNAMKELRRRTTDLPDDLYNEDGETDYWEFSMDGIVDFIDTNITKSAPIAALAKGE